MAFKLRIAARQEEGDPDFEEEEAKAKPKQIPDGPELLRICRMERRPIPDLESEDSLRVAELITDRLAKTPTPYPGRLRPVQALALREAWTYKGLWAPIVVGGGKMLTCYLAPTILKAKRPIYLCPKKMAVETAIEFKKYLKDWHGPTHAQMPIITYELLSNLSSAEELAEDGHTVIKPGRLDRLRPDVIILDECHLVGNVGAAVTARLKYYLRNNPDTIVLAFSGTPFKESIEDAIHIMQWCLGDRTPFPRADSEHWGERKAWAGFLDAKKSMFGRVDIGMLPLLADAMGVPRPDLNDVSAWRRLVAQRILETPGVIGTQDAPLDIPLTVDHWLPSEECDEIHQAIETLVDTRHLPDGTQLADDDALWRYISTLCLGFWQMYDPPPPDSWKAARNAWAKWCRKALRNNKKRIVSEGTMKAALRRGVLDGGGLALLQAWEREEQRERERTGLNEPPSVAQWVSDEAIEEAAAWVDQYKGLVWVGHIDIGRRIGKELGIPYYGSDGGLDVKSGIRINDHRGGPAVASIWACGTGKNLQHFWHQALWMTTPGEQALARIHRPGQKAASVDNWIYLGGQSHFASYERALDVKAAFAEDLTLSPQKLRYAITNMPTAWGLEKRGGTRWARKIEWDDDDL